MKVAISSKGTLLASDVDPRFGRAPWFIVVDIDAGTFDLVENTQNLNAAQGAGVQSAQAVAGCRADAVITGHCGPKAFRALKAGGVKVYTGASGTVADAIEQFKAGSLEESAEADVESHWV